MIPTQDKVNWEDPKQHFAWALKHMPTVAGVGAITNPAMLIGWSEHLWQCGFAHRDYLVSLADEDGKIDVSKLPEQTIRWQQPFRGPNTQFNGAARWTTEDAPPIEPFRVPNVAELTQQEAQYLLEQLQSRGYSTPTAYGPPLGGDDD